MPAIVPTNWPKKEESWGRGRETGPSIEAGGWCYNQGTASGEDATNGGLDDMGAGCKFTHAPGTTGTSTSTTNDINPALSAGYGCSNGMDRAANCRDWQKPIDVKPQQSPKNEKLQSTWMNPYEPCGPEGQSAWHPQGFVAGNGCSAKGDRATDRRDGPVQVEARSRSRQNEPQNTGGIGGWGHYSY